MELGDQGARRSNAAGTRVDLRPPERLVEPFALVRA